MNRSWPTGPRRPPAPATEVHVWRADLGRPDWPPPTELPAEERERAERMLRPGSGRRWSASRWALRLVLSRYLGEKPEAIALRRSEHGKPELAEGPERLSFNLSHSGALALVAVTRGRELGVDIERIDADRDLLALAERALDASAAAAVREAAPADRPTAFYEAWVRHEALVKCFGGGLGSPLPEEPATVAPLDVDRGFAAALAVAGREVLAHRCFSIGSP